MDIYLKNEKLKEDFHFPVNPINKLSDKKNKRFETFDIVDLGEVDIFKKGKNISPINFDTLFPGKYYPFCRYTDIPDAKSSVEKIKKWMDQEEPHRLIITDHDYNELVTISDFQVDEVAGETGDKYISITFRPYRELKIEVLPIPEKPNTPTNNKDTSTSTKKMVVKVNTSLNIRSGPGTNYSKIGSFKNGNEVDVIEISGNWAKIKYSKGKDGIAYVSTKYLKDKPGSPSLNDRADTPKGNTHTVVKGDTLYKISKKFYGDGSKWNKIYDTNKKTIGNNPNVIKVGQKLVIP